MGGANTNVTISNSIASGAVMGNDDVGGLVGEAVGVITIEFSFAANSVTGVSSVGAFVGVGVSTTFESNHFASDMSGVSDAVGDDLGTNTGIATDITGATLAQLQAATMPGENGLFVGWDDTIWDFGDSTELPQLINVGPNP